MLLIGTDFSGIGSPEEALRMARIKHRSVFACEKDPFARTTFEANNETEHFYKDITERNQSETPEVDLYVAGFPCQAFSLAGKQLGFEDVRGTLFFNSADYIRAKCPKVFILENVKGLLSHDKVDKKSKYGRTFNTIINLLARTVNGQEQLPFYQDNLGYNVYHAVLNTKEHGIPQNRERIFIVGIRPDVDNNTFRFPSKEPLLLRLKDILEKEVDEHYYLSDKMLEYLFGRSKNFNSGKINFKGSEDIASAITSASASLDVSDNILVENVGNVNPSGNGMNGQVFHSHGHPPMTMATNYRIRKLTPLECFRLQGFSDAFYMRSKWESVENSERIMAGKKFKPGKRNLNLTDGQRLERMSDSQLYKQAGNSITTRVIMKVILNLKGILNFEYEND